MNDNKKKYRIGDFSVKKIEEQLLRSVDALSLFPTSSASDFEAEHTNLSSADIALAAPQVTLSIHSWLVQGNGVTILIDTGSGNHKERPYMARYHMQNIPYLERLADLGVYPENVDFVFNTHLHADHVGWNTVLEQGNWVPTFPNARYVMPQKEQQYYANLSPQCEGDISSIGIYDDSVLPVIDAGLVDYIAPDGGRYFELFEFIPTPGHSIGHMSILLNSNNEYGLFAGDVMHHPQQVRMPNWNTKFCQAGETARVSRYKILNQAADMRAMYFSMHFPGTSAGYVSRQQDKFGWKYS